MRIESLPSWLGWVWALAGAITVVAALVGAVVGWMLVGDATRAATDSIAVTNRVLVTMADSTEVVDAVFGDVSSSLRDVQMTLSGTSLTFTRASVLTRDLGRVVSDQVPESIEAVRASLPALINTAGVIDTMMRGLSFFGVAYDTDVPFDESIIEIDQRLADIPVLLRAQQPALDAIATDLGAFSSSALEISDDLGRIRARLAQAGAVLDGYALIVHDTTGLVERLESDIVGQARTFRVLLVVVALGVAITQTAPIALGVAVITARRDPIAPEG